MGGRSRCASGGRLLGWRRCITTRAPNGSHGGQRRRWRSSPIAVSKLACGQSSGSDPVSGFADAGQSSAGTDRFGYDAGKQAWVYHLDTKALGLVVGNCHRIDVSVDGTHVANAFVVSKPTK